MDRYVNKVVFQEILLQSLGTNDYVTYIKENMRTWTETIELTDLLVKKYCNATT